MALSDAWDQLATTALLGTDRAGVLPALEEPLANVCAAAGASPESALLAAIASIDLYRRAGVVPRVNTSEISTAPPETLPPISRKSAQHLSQLFSDEFSAILPEFLTEVARVKKRVPESHLPQLLDYAAKHRDHQAAILPTLGARGEWLITRNPIWKLALEKPAGEDFETGSRPARLAYVAHLRKSDPAAARALLEKAWPNEPPDDRAAFIALFADQLSMADEPFLEAALDDKRKEVRSTAADLLARLPESRLAQRMAARLAPLVTIKKKLLGKAILEFSLPAEHTKDMLRDGIPAASNIPGLGGKAFHLSRIIAATPLSFWTASLAIDPPALPAMISKSEWSHAIFRGLAAACGGQRHQKFSQVLLGHWALDLVDADLRGDEETVAQLVRALPAEDREAVIAPLLARKGDFHERDVLFTMLTACDHAWSLNFSKAFLPVLWRSIEKEQSSYNATRVLAAAVAARVHPAIAPAVLEKLQSSDLARSNNLDKFMTLLQLRHDMLKELRT